MATLFNVDLYFGNVLNSFLSRLALKATVALNRETNNGLLAHRRRTHLRSFSALGLPNKKLISFAAVVA